MSASFRWAIPDTPTTNSEAEYFHDGLERGTGGGLLQSGLPYLFWSRAARHYCYNFARAKDGRDDPDGETPYERMKGKVWSGELYIHSDVGPVIWLAHRTGKNSSPVAAVG